MRLAYLLFLLGMVLIIDHSALAKKKKPLLSQTSFCCFIHYLWYGSIK